MLLPAFSQSSQNYRKGLVQRVEPEDTIYLVFPKACGKDKKNVLAPALKSIYGVKTGQNTENQT